MKRIVAVALGLAALTSNLLAHKNTLSETERKNRDSVLLSLTQGAMIISGSVAASYVILPPPISKRLFSKLVLIAAGQRIIPQRPLTLKHCCRAIGRHLISIPLGRTMLLGMSTALSYYTSSILEQHIDDSE